MGNLRVERDVVDEMEIKKMFHGGAVRRNL